MPEQNLSPLQKLVYHGYMIIPASEIFLDELQLEDTARQGLPENGVVFLEDFALAAYGYEDDQIEGNVKAATYAFPELQAVSALMHLAIDRYARHKEHNVFLPGREIAYLLDEVVQASSTDECLSLTDLQDRFPELKVFVQQHKTKSHHNFAEDYSRLSQTLTDAVPSDIKKTAVGLLQENKNNDGYVIDGLIYLCRAMDYVQNSCSDLDENVEQDLEFPMELARQADSILKDLYNDSELNRTARKAITLFKEKAYVSSNHEAFHSTTGQVKSIRKSIDIEAETLYSNADPLRPLSGLDDRLAHVINVLRDKFMFPHDKVSLRYASKSYEKGLTPI